VVRRLVRLRLLPPSFAPYGRWDEEAAAEIFTGWYADRLLGRGHLQAMLDRAGTVGAFHRLCERSLRQHLLNTKDRSQTRNLFARLTVLLDDDPSFIRTRNAERAQDRWYFLATGDDAPREFAGEDSVLVAHAWAVGDLTVIRYRAAARKLSPVLDADELKRFTAAFLTRVGRALTPGLIMRALSARLDLGEVRVENLEEQGPTGAPTAPILPADERLALRETALALLGELSARQALILQRTSEEETVAQIAAAAGCSAGTVVNEQRRIGQLVSRLSENDVERDQLLNILADLVYSPTDE
jgi:DNA-directed RNA polymerase specialized sigma24 family protein